MVTKKRWANIVCNQKMQPYLLIVTDGEWSSHMPVSNSRLTTVKLVAKNIYGVANKRILVTQVFDGNKDGE